MSFRTREAQRNLPPSQRSSQQAFRKACNRCHVSKLKCVAPSSDTAFPECFRCNKAKVRCSYSVRSSKSISGQLREADEFERNDEPETTVSATPLLNLRRGEMSGDPRERRSGLTAPASDSADSLTTTTTVESLGADLSRINGAGFSNTSDWSTPSLATWEPGGGNGQMQLDMANFSFDDETLEQLMEWDQSQHPAMKAADSSLDSELFGHTTMSSTRTSSDFASSGDATPPSEQSQSSAAVPRESMLLEHAAHLCRRYESLVNGTCCQPPSSVEELYQYPVGESLDSVKNFHHILSSMQTGPVTGTQAVQSLSQTSTTLLALHCYVLSVKICARHFLDLVHFLRRDQTSLTPTSTIEIGAFSVSTAPASLGSINPLMRNPLGSIYAMAKSALDCLKAIEGLLGIPLNLSVDPAIGFDSDLSLLKPRTNTAAASGGSAGARAAWSPLAAQVVTALMHAEVGASWDGITGNNPTALATLRSCSLELKDLVRMHLGL